VPDHGSRAIVITDEMRGFRSAYCGFATLALCIADLFDGPIIDAAICDPVAQTGCAAADGSYAAGLCE
jgi:hypothetical protein